MDSLQNTLIYPKFTEDSIRAAVKSKIGERTVWCVVEAPDDIAIYEKFFNSEVSIQPSDVDGKRSCHNVESIVSHLYNEIKDIKLFGIRDADYTRYTSYSCPLNVFLTDARDIEMMMLCSISVSSTLSEHQFSRKIGIASDTTRYLGYLRIFNEVNQTSCSFRNRVAKTSLMWCEQNRRLKENYTSTQFAAFRDECDSNPECSITEANVENFIIEHNLKEEPNYNVCRGHDVVKLLSRMLIGTCYCDHTKLQKHITQSYSFSDFSKTQLFDNISAWAAERGLKVFHNALEESACR